MSGAALALARISFSQLDGQHVCRVDVAASAQPVFARPADGRQHTGFWARIGNSTRQLVGTDRAEYQREHGTSEPSGRAHGATSRYESKYRTVHKRPWARAFHSGNPKAQQRLCTVAGVEQPHRARWSLKVKDTTGNEVWVAACAAHVPPQEDATE